MPDSGFSGHSERQFPVLKAIEGATEASAAALEAILSMGGGHGSGGGMGLTPPANRTGSGFGGMSDTSLADSAQLEKIRKDDLQAFLHGKRPGAGQSEADDFFQHVQNWKPPDKSQGKSGGGQESLGAMLSRSAGLYAAARLTTDIFAGGSGNTSDAMTAHEDIMRQGGTTANVVRNLPANTAMAFYAAKKLIGSAFGDH